MGDTPASRRTFLQSFRYRDKLAEVKLLRSNSNSNLSADRNEMCPL